jgi:hypothetical protein
MKPIDMVSLQARQGLTIQAQQMELPVKDLPSRQYFSFSLLMVLIFIMPYAYLVFALCFCVLRIDGGLGVWVSTTLYGH